MNTPHLTHRASRSQGFTLVELLTVIAIIAILAGILIPVVGRVRASARSSACLSNLRQLGVTMNLYIQANKGMTPNKNYEFYRQLWPYFGDAATGQKAFEAVLGPALPGAPVAGSLFECPEAPFESDAITAHRSYGINSLLLGYGVDPVKYINITTPTKTLIFADVKNTSAISPPTCNARHNGKMNVLYADFHVGTTPLSAEVTNATTSFWTGTP